MQFSRETFTLFHQIDCIKEPILSLYSAHNNLFPFLIRFMPFQIENVYLRPINLQEQKKAGNVIEVPIISFSTCPDGMGHW